MVRPLLLVDAPYLLYRAFFGLPDSIKGADGRPVNALLGSTNTILAVAEEENARAVVPCFGPDAAAYRVELLPAYHAHRPPMPGELAHQWALAPRLYEALGWPVHDHDSLEADDLLGALARAEEEAGGEALILTGDRDLYQCVGERVRVLYMKTGSKGPELVDPAEVRKRYGVPPELVPDFIALRGDPSDGLPGGTGIGDKTASALLERHGSLEGAIAGAMSERSARVRGALLDEADQLRDFREIARLRSADVARPPDRGTDFAGGAEAARARGMTRLAERLEG